MEKYGGKGLVLVFALVVGISFQVGAETIKFKKSFKNEKECVCQMGHSRNDPYQPHEEN